jgi:glycogenin
VQEVNVLDSQDTANLALLKRPELGITFTKLHCWRLTQFEKCVFLDADTLVSFPEEKSHLFGIANNELSV